MLWFPFKFHAIRRTITQNQQFTIYVSASTIKTNMCEVEHWMQTVCILRWFMFWRFIELKSGGVCCFSTVFHTDTQNGTIRCFFLSSPSSCVRVYVFIMKYMFICKIHTIAGISKMLEMVLALSFNQMVHLLLSTWFYSFVCNLGA